jgi:Protein of unknown function (DUF3375)
LAGHAPLIASFLDKVFIQPNLRVVSQSNLVSKLDDLLFHLRENDGGESFPRGAGRPTSTNGRKMTKAFCENFIRKVQMNRITT